MVETKIFSVGKFFVLCLMAISLTGCGIGTSQKPWANGYPCTVSQEAKLKIVYQDEGKFFEGPSWDTKSGQLFFTAWSKDNKQLLRLTDINKAECVLDKTRGINGTFYCPKTGRLLTAEVFAHRLCSYELPADGPTNMQILASSENWNQPNDLCVSCGGCVYFTDPDFAKKQRSSVYMLDTNGIVHKIIDDMTLPNGIMTSLDGSTLYVADSFEKHWKSYDIASDGSVVPGSGKIFFDPETQSTADPDGMTIDEFGNLYFTGLGGLWCVSPAGAKMGFIAIPEFCSNVTFGGTEGKTLYMTCRNVVYSLDMNVRGAAGASEKFPCMICMPEK